MIDVWSEEFLNSHAEAERDRAQLAEINAAAAALRRKGRRASKAGKAERARAVLHRQAATLGVAAPDDGAAVRLLHAEARATCKRAWKNDEVHACGACDGTPAFWARVVQARTAGHGRRR